MRPLLSASPVALACCLWCALGCDSFVTTPMAQDPPACDQPSGALPEARLLTRSEYRRTTQALLGETEDPTLGFPHEPEVEGFTNSAHSHRANPLLVEQFMRAAGSLAGRARDRGLSLLHPCEGQDAVCAQLFIEDFGRRAFRRPLEDSETLGFETLYARLAPSLGHEEALTAIIEAALQSPQFLYRVEAPLGSAESGVVHLGPYELASRLSYFLWGTMPDEPLLEAAESGHLSSAADIETQARRLLDDPRAHERVLEFHEAWLGLEALSSLARSNAPTGMGPALKQSIDAFIDEVFWSEGATLSDLFASPVVYADAVLAPVYQLAQPASGFARYELPAERSGLLTQPALLTLLANSDQSSPIRRGVFVRDRILCAPVPAPPPSVDNSPPDPDPTLTTRERFAVHTEDDACASCHLAIDPIGFTFEGFDQLGRPRTQENGLPIDTRGALALSGDPAIDGSVSGSGELSARLAESAEVRSCVTSKWFTFALGRPSSFADECALSATYASVEASGGNLVELLVSLTKSPAFRVRSAHPAEGNP